LIEGLLYKDLTYRVRHCIFEVHNEIGVGYDEETYHQALIRKFKQEGIMSSSKARKMLIHRGISVREFILDFLIENKVILSLKCLPYDFLPVNFIQLFAELKLWQKHLGLIVNFGLPKVKIERRIFHEKELIIDENYDFIKNRITATDRGIVKIIRDSILNVGKIHGLGFSKTIFKKLIETELVYQKIAYEKEAPIPVNYHGSTIRTYKMRDFLIDHRVILGITALQDTITHYDISRIKSYLQGLKSQIGLAVNYGKSILQIKGIYNDS